MSWEDASPMTIGIGVLCEDGNCMILASDLRVTYSPLSRHDYAGKQWDLLPPFTGAAAIAGTVSVCHDFISELTARFDRLASEAEINFEHVENAVNDSRFHIMKRRANWELKRHLGISLQQLLTGKAANGQPLVSMVIEHGIKIVNEIPFESQIILTGYWGSPDNPKGLWMRVDHTEHVQSNPSPGFFVIGSGSKYARDHLAWRRQNIDRKLPSSLLHVYEALRKARRDRHVGEPMAYVICWKDGRVQRVEPDDLLLRNWARHYKRRNDTNSLDISPIARRQVDFIMK